MSDTLTPYEEGYRAGYEAARLERAEDGLREAAQNVTDRRTLMDDGFWVSQRDMNALDAALARTSEGEG